MVRDLLLLHGATGTPEELSALSRALGDRFSCRTPALVGHGDRIIPERFTLDGFVEDLIGQLDEAGIEQTHVFGYSFGGYVALALAVRHPDRIASCSMLGTQYRWAPRETRALLGVLNRWQAGNRAQGAEGTRIYEVQARYCDWLARRLAGEEILTHDQLRSVRLPVLALSGDSDPAITVEEIRQLRDFIPHAQLAIFPGSAHPVSAFPTTFAAQAIGRFIDQPSTANLQLREISQA
jgi:pimeloyl-ACP methyl ester carboxylesterase